MGYEIEFYKTENGRNPVNDFINSLQKKQISKILQDITLLQKFGSNLHYPYVDSIKGEKYKGLFELRTSSASNNFRVFYFVLIGNKAVLLHAIQKQTNKTPKKELDVALARMKEYKTRGAKDERRT